MAGRGVICNQVVFLQAEDANIILVVHNNKLVGAKLHFPDGGGSRRGQGYADSLLAKDVDFARTEAGLIGTDREEGLDGFIGRGGDLGIDTIAGKLEDWLS